MFRLILVLCLCNFTFSSKLPPTFKTCKRSQSDHSECLRREVEAAIRQLTKPFPKVGLHSFEPLEVTSMSIGEGKGTVNVVQNYKNIKVSGLSNIQVKSVNYDFDKNVFTMTASAKEIKQIADYDFNGRVLLLPVVGTGESTLTLENVDAVYTINFEKVEKDGTTYINPTSSSLTFEPKNVIFDFKNLFNGDKQLGDNLLKVLNENWQEVFKDVKVGYETAYNDFVFQIIKNFFNKVPFNDIFPE